MNLLLISSSFLGSGTYLEHCRTDIKDFLDSCPPGHVLFVPYAGHDLDSYADTAKEFFTELDPEIGGAFISLHRTHNPRETIEVRDIKAIFIGGGNTFRLLKALQENDLLDAIRQKVEKGAGYMGTSAGSVVACPTIMTTNDMPIVELRDFKALGLVDFQINPHFLPSALVENHKGETREQRIREYHEENAFPVIGLPEKSWIRTNDNKTILAGGDAVIFEKDSEPYPWLMGSELSLHDTR